MLGNRVPITKWDEEEIIGILNIPRTMKVGKKRYRFYALVQEQTTRDTTGVTNSMRKGRARDGWKTKTKEYTFRGRPLMVIYTDMPRTKDPYGWI